jgi:hypothetical protein
MVSVLFDTTGELRLFVSWKIHNIYSKILLCKGGGRGARLDGGRQGAAVAGGAPAGRVPAPTCSTFPPVLAVNLARILLTLLLTAGGSPLPCRTWSCITLIRTKEETTAAQIGGWAWATLEEDSATGGERADRQGEAEGRRGGGGENAGGRRRGGGGGGAGGTGGEGGWGRGPGGRLGGGPRCDAGVSLRLGA